MAPEESPEWTARRAAWRENWEPVREYVNEQSISERINSLIDEDPHESKPRALIAIGVFTSLALEEQDLCEAKRYWSEALAIYRQRCPSEVSALRDYFEGSIGKYAELNGITVDAQEFGF